jgi:NAD(P)-dependent dehydrogenase (short-subunit alcohol dehydrogenase family)
MTYLTQLYGLSGKTALVTGGAVGIGRMCAEALVQAGARVMIASRKGEACEQAAAEMNALGASGRCEGFAGDVGNEAGVMALAAAVNARTQKLDILVNNAGKSWGAPLGQFPFKAWDSVMSVNMAGPFTLTQALFPLLEAAASAAAPARVVNIGSVMGTQPRGDTAYSYSASKAAMHHITQILAKELAKRHITVNALAPGPFATKMMAFATATDAKVASVNETVPLGRLGQPDDIAAALLFLCGRGGAYTTGAILPVDGGLAVTTSGDIFGLDH